MAGLDLFASLGLQQWHEKGQACALSPRQTYTDRKLWAVLKLVLAQNIKRQVV